VAAGAIIIAVDRSRYRATKLTPHLPRNLFEAGRDREASTTTEIPGVGGSTPFPESPFSRAMRVGRGRKDAGDPEADPKAAEQRRP
jgi:hypothetical protein